MKTVGVTGLGVSIKIVGITGFRGQHENCGRHRFGRFPKIVGATGFGGLWAWHIRVTNLRLATESKSKIPILYL